MCVSFVERISTPLLFAVDLSLLCEPHTELGLWNTNSKLFIDFASNLSAQDQGLSIIEMDQEIFGRRCCKFPKFIRDSSTGSFLLTKLAAWVICCAVYNFFYTKTDVLTKPL